MLLEYGADANVMDHSEQRYIYIECRILMIFVMGLKLIYSYGSHSFILKATI